MKIPKGLADILNRLLPSQETEELAFEIVTEEIREGFIKEGMMAKAISQSLGDERRAKALYMKFRAQILKKELPNIIQAIQVKLQYDHLTNLLAKEDEKFEIIRNEYENFINNLKPDFIESEYDDLKQSRVERNTLLIIITFLFALPVPIFWQFSLNP